TLFRSWHARAKLAELGTSPFEFAARIELRKHGVGPAQFRNGRGSVVHFDVTARNLPPQPRAVKRERDLLERVGAGDDASQAGVRRSTQHAHQRVGYIREDESQPLSDSLGIAPEAADVARRHVVLALPECGFDNGGQQSMNGPYGIARLIHDGQSFIPDADRLVV